MAEFRLGKSLISRNGGFTTNLTLLAVGFGVGALCGVLSAPKSGKQLRREMRRKVEDARDAVEKKVETARDAVERVGEEVGRRAGDLWERGEELAEAARRTAEPVTRILRQA